MANLTPPVHGAQPQHRPVLNADQILGRPRRFNPLTHINNLLRSGGIGPPPPRPVLQPQAAPNLPVARPITPPPPPPQDHQALAPPPPPPQDQALVPPPPPPPQDQALAPPPPPPPQDQALMPPPPIDAPPPSPEPVVVIPPPAQPVEPEEERTTTDVDPTSILDALTCIQNEIFPEDPNREKYTGLAYNKQTRQIILIESNRPVTRAEEGYTLPLLQDTSTYVKTQFLNQIDDIIEVHTAPEVQTAIRKTHQVLLRAKIFGTPQVFPKFIDSMLLDTAAMWRASIAREGADCSDENLVDKLREARQGNRALTSDASHARTRQAGPILSVKQMGLCLERLSKEVTPEMQYVRPSGTKLITPLPFGEKVTFSAQRANMQAVVHVIQSNLPTHQRELGRLAASLDLTLSFFIEAEKQEPHTWMGKSPRLETLQSQIKNLQDLQKILLPKYKSAPTAPFASAIGHPTQNNRMRTLQFEIARLTNLLESQNNHCDNLRTARGAHKRNTPERIILEQHIEQSKEVIKATKKQLRDLRRELPPEDPSAVAVPAEEEKAD